MKNTISDCGMTKTFSNQARTEILNFIHSQRILLRFSIFAWFNLCSDLFAWNKFLLLIRCDDKLSTQPTTHDKKLSDDKSFSHFNFLWVNKNYYEENLRMNLGCWAKEKSFPALNNIKWAFSIKISCFCWLKCWSWRRGKNSAVGKVFI